MNMGLGMSSLTRINRRVATCVSFGLFSINVIPKCEGVGRLRHDTALQPICALREMETDNALALKPIENRHRLKHGVYRAVGDLQGAICRFGYQPGF